jgi:signal peptidase II
MAALQEEQGSAGTGPSQRALIVLVAALLLAIDQLTKWLVVTHLQRGDFIRVCSFVQIKHTYNTGVAFGLWATGGKALPVLAAACIIVLLIWGARYARHSALVGLALALVVGGALGNMLDRIRLGHVVDFIDFGFWPVFNVADACVVGGALLLLYHSLRRHEPAGSAEVGRGADKDDA